MISRSALRSRRALIVALATLAAGAGGALVTACAALSGLSSFDRGLCEIDGCVDGSGGVDATTDGDRGDGEASGGDATDDSQITPIEPFVCGTFTCKSTQRCCAPRDGGGLGCPSTCNGVGVDVKCFRDTQCGAGLVCCALAEALPNQGGDLVTSVECVRPAECTAYRLCDDAHPCQGDAGCVAPAPGSPRVCVGAPLGQN